MHTHRDNWVLILGSLHLAMYVCSWKLSKKGLRMGTLRSRPQGRMRLMMAQTCLTLLSQEAQWGGLHLRGRDIGTTYGDDPGAAETQMGGDAWGVLDSGRGW